MKNILLPVSPEEIGSILAGETEFLVRRTRPMCALPFKVFMYCTKDKNDRIVKVQNGYRCIKGAHRLEMQFRNGIIFEGQVNGLIIGEFICDKVYNLFRYGVGVGVEIDENGTLASTQNFCDKTIFSEYALGQYIGVDHAKGYGWHVPSPEFYIYPRTLEFFRKPLGDVYCHEHKERGCDPGCIAFGCSDFYCKDNGKWEAGFRHVPHPWAYVEEV